MDLFFFEGTTVNSEAYLAMLQNWWMELLFEGERTDFIFQQDGAPPHWSLNVRQYLNATLHTKWIGRAGNDDCVLLHWPPRSPNLTPCDFFHWGYVKALVYVPPLPTSVDDLKTRITEVLKNHRSQYACLSLAKNGIPFRCVPCDQGLVY